MASVVGVVLVISLFMREERHAPGSLEGASSQAEPLTITVIVGRLREALTTPTAGWVIALLATYKLGESLVDPVFQPVLLDQGMEAADIGLIVGTFGMVASIAGSLGGGFLATRGSPLRALGYVAVLRVVAIFGQWLIASFGPHFDNFAIACRHACRPPPWRHSVRAGKATQKPVLTGKGIIATNNATSNASSITPIAGPTDGTSSTRDAASGGDDGGSAGSAGGTASNGVSVETLVVVAVPPKQRRKRVTTASRKNTTRDSSSVHGSDGDGILSVCGGHHVVTTGKAGTVKVKGKRSKVAGGGDRGGRSGGDTVAVLVKRRKQVAADSSSPATSPATTSCPASSTTAATDASGRGRGRGRVVPVTPFLQEQLRSTTKRCGRLRSAWPSCTSPRRRRWASRWGDRGLCTRMVNSLAFAATCSPLWRTLGATA
jgi:hypothetical protein